MTNLWSTETIIGPLHFQAGCHKRWQNMLLLFLCLLVHFFLLVNVCFSCVSFVFLYEARRLAWGTSLKLPILCWVGCKTTTQSSSLCLRWWSGSDFCYCWAETAFPKPGKPGIVREFCKPGKVSEKSGNLRYGQGIFCDMSHGSRLAYRWVDLCM